jgi:hypothetical protein
MKTKTNEASQEKTTGLTTKNMNRKEAMQKWGISLPLR